MDDSQVRVERLPRMWVASVLGRGEAPELEAWRRLRNWAIPKGLLNDCEQHPTFGFNNPNPSVDKKDYGYELWIRIDGPESGEDGIVYKEFEGGLYAVTTCRLQGDPDIVTTWKALWNWAQGGQYRWRRAQELERVLNPNATEEEFVLDLYLPVEEQGAAADGRV